MDHRWDTAECDNYHVRKYISHHTCTCIVELTFHATVILSSILLILTFCGTLGTIDKTKVILYCNYYHTKLPFAIISRSFKNALPPVPAQLIAATLIV